MKKKLKTPTLVTTAILTMITVVFWIAFEVYRTITTKPAPTVPQEVIAPLNPTLDEGTLNKLQLRINLDENQVGNLAVADLSSATPLPTETPVASPSATATTTGSASPVSSPQATP